MYTMKEYLTETIASIKEAGLYKGERPIITPQSAHIEVETPNGRISALNMCANNYLGMAGNPDMAKAAKEGIDRWGFGLASVRFICGTQDLHKMLEAKISEFLQTEDTILYTSCFDANGGLFETLLTAEDAVISDALNHASIIDGIRLCKAKRYRYANNDMVELEERLKEAKEAGARYIMIATDGVFSMDGVIADLESVCNLAEKYGAMVMVDDSHAVGVCGANGRGSIEHCGVMGRVDIITGTLGKGLGGASGGYTSGRKEIIDLLRQRSRPYLFSNTLCPSVAYASYVGLDMLMKSNELREKLWANTERFRRKMTEAGFNIKPGIHPICPVMLGDPVVAQTMAAKMLEHGVYVTGFFYPVVPKGADRIRVQCSAAHSTEDIDFAVNAFIEVRKEMGL